MARARSDELEVPVVLTTDKFDKQIARLENKITKTEQKKVLVEARIEGQEGELQRQIEKVQELRSAYNELKALREKKDEGKTTWLEEQRIIDLKNEYGTLEQINMSLEKNESKQRQMTARVEETKMKYEEMGREIRNDKAMIDTLRLQKHQAEVQKLKDGFANVGSTIQNTIYKLGRMALGVIGIRTALSGLRRMSSELANYDQQYATDLEYIRFVLAQAVAPILRGIVSLALTLMQIINAITSALFGVPVFGNASADAFKRMKDNASGVSKSVGGASKAVKELRKQLLGFDEANVLTDDKSGGGGGTSGVGGVGIPLPSLDVADVQLPEWLSNIEKLRDKLKLIAEIILGIIGSLALIKLLDIAGFASKIVGWIRRITDGLGVLGSALKIGGIIAIIAGIIVALKGLEQYLKNPTWENFRKILIGIGIAAAGLTAVFISMANPIGAVIAGIATGVTALAVVIGDWVDSESEAEWATRKTRMQEEALIQSEKKLKKAREELTTATDNYVNAVDRAEQAEKDLEEAQNRTGLSGKELYDLVQIGTLDYKNMNEQQKEVYKAYLSNRDAQDKLKTSTDEFNKAEEETARRLFTTAAYLDITSKDYDDYKKKVVDAYNSSSISAEDAAMLITHAMQGMDAETRKVFTQNLPNNIKSALNPSTYSQWENKFKSWWNNNLIGGLRKNVSLDISGVIRTSWFKPSGFASGGIVKMATGGIINMPGKGVPLASAIGGESGKEGIVPLTDQQAMAELGREIGRWITINATVVNNMNGRQLSREIQRVANEEDFAFNG